MEILCHCPWDHLYILGASIIGTAITVVLVRWDYRRRYGNEG